MLSLKVLQEATKFLKTAGIGTARLDSLVLLEDVTGEDRSFLLANPDYEISHQKYEKFKNLLKKRAEHIPLAYIRGHTEFYGYNFVIKPNVLVPRPESETMIDELKIIPKTITQPKIADIGTGCGALGITAKLELNNAQVWLIDIDQKCLENAQTNVDLFTLPIKVVKGDLMAEFIQQVDVLLCNLPYVPDDFNINRAATHESKIAIYGGPDGLDLYRKLFIQLKNRSSRPLYILSEALPSQHAALKEIAYENNYQEIKKNDFIQVFMRTK